MTSNRELLKRIILAHQEAVVALATIEDEIEKAADAVIAALQAGKKILLCGNGGSAADAQHIAAEFVGRFQLERPALPALALHTDTSALTSIANDYGFDEVYARQIEAHGRPGDVLLAISTSGKSKSVLRAVKEAKKRSIEAIGMTGRDGGELRQLCGILIRVPSDVTARIQECHILIGHAICEIAERAIAG